MIIRSRFVFDTNTIVSAFLFEKSVPGQALKKALDHGALLLSLPVAEELAKVLRRDKFDRYLSRKIREEFLKALVKEATFVDVVERIRVCSDPQDDKFLELAVSGNASYLVSGDKHLTSLHPFRSILIVTPKGFLETL